MKNILTHGLNTETATELAKTILTTKESITAENDSSINLVEASYCETGRINIYDNINKKCYNFIQCEENGMYLQKVKDTTTMLDDMAEEFVQFNQDLIA